MMKIKDALKFSMENKNKLMHSLDFASINKGNFYVDDVYCKYNIIDFSKPIVITFSPMLEDDIILTHIDAINTNYTPWGYDYIKNEGLNIIAFSPIQSCGWYRSPIFHEFIIQLGDKLKKFPKILGYGSSMGGYGVSAFADALHMNNILLINPISTLNKELAGFEKRFRSPRKYNWQNSFHDAAETICSGYIIYDPIFDLDIKHAERYKNLKHLKIPGLGHSMPLHLAQIGMLKWVVNSFLHENTIDIQKFNLLARNRRKYKGYYSWLLSGENKHLTKKRKEIIEAYKLKFETTELAFREVDIDSFKSLEELVDTLSELYMNIGEKEVAINLLTEKEKICEKDLKDYKEFSAILRDISTMFENENKIKLAYEIMEKAYLLKPHGPFIKMKFKELENKIIFEKEGINE